jgi:hypothetical protein
MSSLAGYMFRPQQIVPLSTALNEAGAHRDSHALCLMPDRNDEAMHHITPACEAG